MDGEKKYVWSTNDERYFSDTYSTREEALEAGRRCDPGQTIFTGVSRPVRLRDYAPSGDWIVESIAESMWDRVGDVVDDWPVVPREALEELSQRFGRIVEEWAEEWDADPQFFAVVEVQEHGPLLLEETQLNKEKIK